MASPAAVATTTFIDDAPELHYPSEFPVTLTKRQAIHLDRKGLTQKAEAHQVCRSVRVRGCPNDHDIAAHREGRSCNQCFCPDCRQRLAEEAYGRWERVMPRIEKSNVPLTYIELRVPMERDREQVEDYLDGIRDKVVEGLATYGGDDFVLGPFWRNVLGFEDGKAVFRFLYSGTPLPTETWQSLFPGAKIIVCNIKAHLVRHFFKQMVEPLKLTDPIDRAEHEALFHRMRRLRAMNVTTDPDAHQREELYTDTQPDIVDNSTEGHKSQSGPRHKCCSVCGAETIPLTGWSSPNPSNEELQRLMAEARARTRALLH